MKKQNFDYVIAGAGFAGLSTAYFLARQRAGRICVVEKESAACLQASGQNASMVSRVVEDPVLARAAAEGADFLQNELGPLLRFEILNTGSLYFGNRKQMEPLEHFVSFAARNGIPIERWARAAAVGRFPFLSDTEFEEALYCESDGVADVPSLARAWTQALEALGVRFVYGFNGAFEREGQDSFGWKLDGSEANAKVFINAAGAWAGALARSLGASAVAVRPRRRHLFVSGPFLPVESAWPILWDMTHDIYARPSGGSLLLSPCDNEDAAPGPAETDPNAEPLLRSKLKRFLPKYSALPLARVWAGLRTFSSDGRFVIGPDPRLKNFFWVACLDGHGLTACGAAGRIASEWLLNGKTDRESETAFSPARFEGKFRLKSGAHF